MPTFETFKDLSVTFKKHPVSDDLVTVKDKAAIVQAITALLLTNKGERPFQPNLGCGITESLFEPLDYGTANQITGNIKSTIDTFEPRISVLNLRALPNMDDNGFDVEMTYEIRGTDDPPVTVDFFLARTR